MTDPPFLAKTKYMSQTQSLVTRSASVIINLTAGQSKYTFNNTTFRNKTITKIEVQDTTGQGLVLAPDGSTLAATSVIAQSYITLVSSINTTDQIIQNYPTSRFLPSIPSSGTGSGQSNYNQIELSGYMNFDIQNSYLFFPDSAIPQSNTSILIEVWYDDRDPLMLQEEYKQYIAPLPAASR